jgi:hypothetical protein
LVETVLPPVVKSMAAREPLTEATLPPVVKSMAATAAVVELVPEPEAKSMVVRPVLVAVAEPRPVLVPKLKSVRKVLIPSWLRVTEELRPVEAEIRAR